MTLMTRTTITITTPNNKQQAKTTTTTPTATTTRTTNNTKLQFGNQKHEIHTMTESIQQTSNKKQRTTKTMSCLYINTLKTL